MHRSDKKMKNEKTSQRAEGMSGAGASWTCFATTKECPVIYCDDDDDDGDDEGQLHILISGSRRTVLHKMEMIRRYHGQAHTHC